MKKEVANLGELAGQLEKLRGAVEAARGKGQSDRRARRALVKRPGVQSPGFAEFSGAQLLDTAASTAGTVVELADATGARLTIRLAAGQPLDVAAMVTLFRGAQQCSR